VAANRAVTTILPRHPQQLGRGRVYFETGLKYQILLIAVARDYLLRRDLKADRLSPVTPFRFEEWTDDDSYCATVRKVGI
jgi:hypothetical protein